MIPIASWETEKAHRDTMAFPGHKTGQKKAGLNSALSLPSWAPGSLPRELWGGLCWTSVYSYGGDMGEEVSSDLLRGALGWVIKEGAKVMGP